VDKTFAFELTLELELACEAVFDVAVLVVVFIGLVNPELRVGLSIAVDTSNDDQIKKDET
jgi:hypothetical protein